jgi:ribokinase
MPRVIVVGSSNTDMTVRVPGLPSPGETVLGGAFAMSPGGKGANQAVAARRAGADVVFITAVGDDDLGRNAIEGYRREGIETAHIRTVTGCPSGVALIFVSDQGENVIGVAPGANSELTAEQIDALPQSLFRAGDILLVGLEIPLPAAIRTLERGKSSGLTVILNPAPAPKCGRSELRRLLASTDLITPNEGEARALLESTGATMGSSDEQLRALLALGPKTLIVTLGARGCLVASKDDLRETIEPPRVVAVDTVGAGDVFNGSLAVALSEGRTPIDAARWAVAAAAIAVTRTGAQSAAPTRDEIDRLASQHPGTK